MPLFPTKPIPMWKSILLENLDLTDDPEYLFDNEDYIIISIDRATGLIIQQLEYEYSLDRFLEHLASLGVQERKYVLPEMRDMMEVGKAELRMPSLAASGISSGRGMNRKPDEKPTQGGVSSRSESPETDVDFRDLDGISDPESAKSWSTYSVSGDEGLAHKKTRSARADEKSRKARRRKRGGKPLAKRSKNTEESVVETPNFDPMPLTTQVKGDFESLETAKKEVEKEAKVDGPDLEVHDVVEGPRGLALAAIANGILIAGLWAAERWEAAGH